jgi:hypothetical protein
MDIILPITRAKALAETRFLDSIKLRIEFFKSVFFTLRDLDQTGFNIPYKPQPFKPSDWFPDTLIVVNNKTSLLKVIFHMTADNNRFLRIM